MTDQIAHDESVTTARSSALARRLLLGGAALLVAAGLLLWLREGDRLFTEGLIAAIMGCF